MPSWIVTASPDERRRGVERLEVHLDRGRGPHETHAAPRRGADATHAQLGDAGIRARRAVVREIVGDRRDHELVVRVDDRPRVEGRSLEVEHVHRHRRLRVPDHDGVRHDQIASRDADPIEEEVLRGVEEHAVGRAHRAVHTRRRGVPGANGGDELPARDHEVGTTRVRRHRARRHRCDRVERVDRGGQEVPFRIDQSDETEVRRAAADRIHASRDFERRAGRAAERVAAHREWLDAPNDREAAGRGAERDDPVGRRACVGRELGEEDGAGARGDRPRAEGHVARDRACDQDIRSARHAHRIDRVVQVHRRSLHDLAHGLGPIGDERGQARAGTRVIRRSRRQERARIDLGDGHAASEIARLGGRAQDADTVCRQEHRQAEGAAGDEAGVYAARHERRRRVERLGAADLRRVRAGADLDARAVVVARRRHAEGERDLDVRGAIERDVKRLRGDVGLVVERADLDAHTAEPHRGQVRVDLDQQLGRVAGAASDEERAQREAERGEARTHVAMVARADLGRRGRHSLPDQ